MSIRSLITADHAEETSIDFDAVKLQALLEQEPLHIAGKTKKSISSPASTRALENSVINKIASNRSRHAILSRKFDQLEKNNEQILNSSNILKGLSNDFSAASVHKQNELERDLALKQALEEKSDFEKSRDVRDLATLRAAPQSNQSVAIPGKVLTNVQQTTGISPEEINKLMNQ